MQTPDSHVVVRRPVITAGGDRAIRRDRLLVLGDLVSLREVGIEIILASENRMLVNRTAERECRANRVVHGGPIENRQRARQAEADGTNVRVGRRAERRATAAE